jgi:cell division protein FtsQ
VKRPQGFDRPAQSRPAAGSSAGSAARPAPASPAEATGAQARAARRPDAVGEAAPRPVLKRPGAGADTVHTEPIEILDVVSDSAGGPAAASHDSAGEPDTTARRRRAARRAVAAAARERRRYERAEVRRFTVRSRRRRLAWGVSLGAVTVLVAGVVIGAYSPLMALREVRVEGASRVPAAEVADAFAPMLGTPLTMLDRDEVQGTLSKFPLIETYQVEAVPPGTLVVRLVERTPVGVIDTPEGLALVDAAGVVIERPGARPEGQPLITVEGGVTDDGFRAVAAVVRSLPPEVRGLLTGAGAETADDVQLELASGARVVWGSAEQSARKAAVLATLMAAVPPDTVGEYDVSSPESVVTR